MCFCATVAVAALVVAHAHGAPIRTFEVGVQSNGSLLDRPAPDVDQEMAEIAGTGSKVIRLTMSWRRVASVVHSCREAASTTKGLRLLENPDHPCYDWSAYDAVVRAAARHDIDVVASVFQVPVWASGSTDPYYVGESPSEFRAVSRGWAAFATAAANRYRPTGSSVGVIDRWTIGNEPNSEFFWHPHDELAPIRYANLYVLAARKMRAAAPGIQLAPGPTGTKSTMKPAVWLAAALPELERLGGEDVIDAWAHNPYPAATKGPRDYVPVLPSIGLGNLKELFRILDENPATRGVPVWATEFGYQTNPPDLAFGVSPSLQAAYMAECFEILYRYRRVTLALWYGFRDNEIERDWQSGLIRSDGTSKPARAMFVRPVSRSASKVVRGRVIRFWGRSLVDANAARLQWSRDGVTWRRVRHQQRDPLGVVTGHIRMPRDARFGYVRVVDSFGEGPSVSFKGVKKPRNKAGKAKLFVR